MAPQPAILGAARLGNFRLGHLPPELAATRASRVRILLAGVDARTRVAGLTIRDVLNDAPNSCSLTIDGTEQPLCEQSLRVTLSAGAVLLFNGAIQSVGLSYEGQPDQIVYPSTAIDDTARANRRRPFGTWSNLSASLVAQTIMAQFAPGFTIQHVQANLPPVTIILDGTEGMSGALKQITTQIGGYFYFEDTDLHLFITEDTAAPDPIDGTPGRLLDEPPIAITRDDSQLRTRQYGRGHGEELLSDVLAGETILPVANAEAWFGTVAAGGRAIALSARLTYAAVRAGGGGSLIGPGAAPSVAPSLAVVLGNGLGSGSYWYAYTFVTAAGESLPSPIGVANVGLMTSPTTAPTAVARAGAGINDGVHQYAYTDVTATGETLPTPVASVTHGPGQANPTAIGTVNVSPFGTGNLTLNANYAYAFTFKRSSDNVETGLSPAGPFYSGANGSAGTIPQSGMSPMPSGWVREWYRTKANGGTFFKIPPGKWHYVSGSSGTDFGEEAYDAELGAPAPTGNATAVNQTTLSNIAPGPTGTTARKLYRTAANSSQLRLLATINDNTTTTWIDASGDGSLGANAPTVNTATANNVAVFFVATGPANTTKRKIYRTLVNQAVLHLWGTVNDNVSTNMGLDNVPDAAIAGNATPPVADTSGLTQPSGQVNAGSPTLLVANPAPFPATGGWVLIGTQAIRYTGVSGSNLTGIPTSGVGALQTTAIYGTQVLPAPVLLGVTGAGAMQRGTLVNVWVQRDDLAAQAEQAAVDAANGIVPADGIYEGPPLVDERRNESSMIALCDANLAMYARPIVTVTYACRDVKTKSGKTIVIDLDSPAIHEELTIQEVTITEIDIAPGLLPRFSVMASSVRFSLDDILRRLLTSSDAQTG